MKIHHDIKNNKPDPGYTAILAEIMGQILPFISPFISDTEYYFDPAEPLRPVFHRLYRTDRGDVLYLARLDLSFRPHYCEILEMGNNDLTHLFSSSAIFLDTDFLPVEKIVQKSGGITEYEIRQSVSQTWIGETGRGYFIQGIWMDSELTKFFTRLFLPESLLTYPYYPYSCKYRTLAYFPFLHGVDYRQGNAEKLQQAYEFLDPYMREIEHELRDSVFNHESALFRKLRGMVKDEWLDDFKSLKITRYLDGRGMREYELVV